METDMALELGIAATMKNEMAGLLVLKSHTIEPASAAWVQPPPAQIPGNSNGAFSAAVAGATALTGTVVYQPQGSSTDLTFTFTVNGSSNTAQASYPSIGPTVGAQITQGNNATATYTYAR
jgi:hypothetical protein